MNEQRFLFIRHGETIANEQQLAYGLTESPLNAKGKAQAHATGLRLQGWSSPYNRMLTSPLGRAQETAAIVNQYLNLPLEIDPGLVESNLGDWEGITYAEMLSNGYATKSIRDDHFSEHGGESPQAVSDRVSQCLTAARHRYPNENLIFVSHGSAIAHGMAVIMDTQPKFGYQYLMHNGAITEVSLQATPTLLHLNNYDHLAEELTTPKDRPDNVQRV